MTQRTIFLCFLILFVSITMRLGVNPVDSETASIAGITVGNALLSNKWFLLAALAGAALFWRAIGNAGRRLGGLPLALLALAGASIVWGLDKSVTGYSFLGLLGCYLYALCANRILGAEATLRTMWWLCSIVVLISVVLAASGSSYGIMAGIHAGAWRGLFGHKNLFGPFIAIHAMLTLFGRRFLRLGLPLVLMLIAMDFAVLALVKSSTAILATLAGMAAGCAFASFRSTAIRRLWQALCGVCLVSAATLLATAPDLVADTFNKSDATGNRTLLWQTAYRVSWTHWLGTGIGTTGGTKLSETLQEAVHRKDAQSPQSGYLTLALDLGWGGVALYVAWLVWNVIELFLARRASAFAPLLASAEAVLAVEGIAETPFGYSANLALLLLLIVLVAFRDDLAARDAEPLPTRASLQKNLRFGRA